MPHLVAVVDGQKDGPSEKKDYRCGRYHTTKTHVDSTASHVRRPRTAPDAPKAEIADDSAAPLDGCGGRGKGVWFSSPSRQLPVSDPLTLLRDAAYFATLKPSDGLWHGEKREDCSLQKEVAQTRRASLVNKQQLPLPSKHLLQAGSAYCRGPGV